MRNNRNRRSDRRQEEFIDFYDDDEFEDDDDDQERMPRSLILIEQMIYDTGPHNAIRPMLLELRRLIIDEEITFQEARRVIEEFEQMIEKLTSPANRVGTLIGLPSEDCANVVIGGSEYYTNIDPQIDPTTLKIGTSVLLNEAFVIVGDLGGSKSGQIVTVTDVLPDGRIRVGQEQGLNAIVLQLSTDLANQNVKINDTVRADPNFKVALEKIESKESKDYYVEEVPEVPWEKVGGLDDTIQKIKDTIELPILHPELFDQFDFTMPKGFLLYGPPGCGKTLIGKATAYNLTQRLIGESGDEINGSFLHIKGPEILNMWLGESERKVREIFQIARQKKSEGSLPFVFIDEAESILGTRRSLRAHNISNTVVPMFCAEMDGIESLQDVVIILATNRPDLIDPAILRPGRIDRKIKVRRPDRDAAIDIFKIYLTPQLPIDPQLLEAHEHKSELAILAMIDEAVDQMFARTEANRFLEISLRSGKREILYRGDLCSGAIIASIVQRAKETAIKRAIDDSQLEIPREQRRIGIRTEDLINALRAEFSENEIFPSTDNISDWLQLVDHEPENVVKVSPIRPEKRSAKRQRTASTVI